MIYEEATCLRSNNYCNKSCKYYARITFMFTPTIYLKVLCSKSNKQIKLKVHVHEYIIIYWKIRSTHVSIGDVYM